MCGILPRIATSQGPCSSSVATVCKPQRDQFWTSHQIRLGQAGEPRAVSIAVQLGHETRDLVNQTLCKTFVNIFSRQ